MSDNNTQQQTQQQSDWQKRELGALWLKQSKTQKYFSGHVKIDDGFGGEKSVNLVVFSNRNKTKPNQPDFRIYRSKERNEEAQETQEVADAQPSAVPAMSTDSDSNSDQQKEEELL